MNPAPARRQPIRAPDPARPAAHAARWRDWAQAIATRHRPRLLRRPGLAFALLRRTVLVFQGLGDGRARSGGRALPDAALRRVLALEPPGSASGFTRAPAVPGTPPEILRGTGQPALAPGRDATRSGPPHRATPPIGVLGTGRPRLPGGRPQAAPVPRRLVVTVTATLPRPPRRRVAAPFGPVGPPPALAGREVAEHQSRPLPIPAQRPVVLHGGPRADRAAPASSRELPDGALAEEPQRSAFGPRVLQAGLAPQTPGEALDLERLTDQIVRRIDERILAHRERLGRVY